MHVPLRPPPLHELLEGIPPERWAVLVQRYASTEELHWDKLIHLSPPAGLTTREWWVAIKLARASAAKPLPLLGTDGRPVHIRTPDSVLEVLHELDKQLAGRISMSESITSAGTRDRYLFTSLMEEAITSSQLEGAVTSRRVAKEMLRSGRPPRDRSEQMIANNFAAMRRVREVQQEPLSPALVCDLHRIVTQDTLDDPSGAGRLEQPDEPRVRVWGHDDQVLHTPPPAAELPGRLDELCRFANGETGEGFVHPVVRAVVLHFWLGYDHYFTDGNGRTARAIFYWSLLREGYWLAEFLTISSILKEAPIAYAQSFLYTETDDNDLTYFLAFHLDVLMRSVRALQDYLGRKANEVRQVELLVRTGTGLNHRQRAVLGVALRNSDATFTIEGHRASHDVVYQTARADLLDLAGRGLLLQQRRGKAFVFDVPPDLTERLHSVT